MRLKRAKNKESSLVNQTQRVKRELKKKKEFISEKNTKTQKESESSSLSKLRLRYSNVFVYFL